MDVVVRKSSSEVVRPPEMVTKSTTDHINLSPYDKGVMCQPVTVFLVFDHSIHQPAEAIKRALSKSLLHYLPVSGRLAAGPGQHDELRITLTGEGVPFVAATAKCALKDVMFFDQSPLVEQLAIYYPAELCGLGDPLLMMQVTEFSCGGFVVGATWNHAVADAAGMGQFLQAVGELARGLASPSVVPVRWDDGLLPGPPRPNDGFMQLLMSLQPMDVAVVDITVPSKVINGIKEEYRVHSHGVLCTTFEAVTALLWQCRTRAIGLANPEDPVGMAFVVNARKYVPARDGYYGNCITAKLVMATAGAVANGRLVDVVEMIQRAKRQIAGQFQEGGGADVEAQHVGGMVGYNLFVVTSWRNLGLEEVDFGGGRPVRVTSYAPERVRLMACVERQGIDGSANVRSGFITKEHAGTFRAKVSARLKL